LLGSKDEYSEAAKMKILKAIAVGIFTATIMLQINGCSTLNDTIQIGVLPPLTGSQASFGEWKKMTMKWLRIRITIAAELVENDLNLFMMILENPILGELVQKN
jgi:hypothetical protein